MKDEDIACSLTAAGIALGVALSVYGSCEGMILAGTASILRSQNRAILGPTYFIMVLISTIFFSSFLVSLVVATNITAALTVEKSIRYFAACAMLGVTAVVSGKACGSLGKRGFKTLSEKPRFFPVLMVLFGMVEFILIIVLVCALLLIY